MTTSPEVQDTPEVAPCQVTSAERAFTYIFLTFAAFSWSGLVLAELHRYRRITLIPAGALVTFLAWRFFRKGLQPPAVVYRSLDRASLVWILFWFLAGTWLVLHAGEFLFEGIDASVYLATADTIEKSQGITFHDAFLEIVPQHLRPSLFRRDANWPHLLNRFTGGIQILDGQDTIIPNFFHLLPVSIATFDLLFGSGAGFLVSPILGLLGVAALWLLGRRLSSPLTGVLASALLFLNLAQIWFSWLPISETLMQFLVLAGLYFTVVAMDGGPRVFPAAAGLAFGLAALCRIDVWFLITPVIVFALVMWAWQRGPTRAWMWYAVPLGLLTLHGVLHGFTVARPYTLRTLYQLFGHRWVNPWSVALVAAALLGIVGVAAVQASPRFRSRLRPFAILVGALLGAAIVARLGTKLVGGYLAILISRVAIAGAGAGMVLMLVREAPLRVLPAMALFLASSLTYLESARSAPEMPWLFRRYIAVVVPLALLFTAYAVVRISRGRSRIGALILLVPLYLGLTYVAGSAPLLTDPPMRDVATTLRQFANTFPTTSLLLMDRSVPSHLGPAINYRFGRDTLIVFRDVDTMPDALRGLVRIAFARGRQVFVVTKGIGDQGGDSLWRSDLAGFTVAPRGTFPLRYMMLRSTREILPRTVAPIEDLLEVYRILPAGASAAILPTPAKLDVGPLDFGFLLKGFYAREEMPSATARWMQSGAQMALPRLSTSPADHPMLAIRMAAYRPPGIAAPTLRLSVNESPVASIPGVTPGFTVYRFPLSDTIVTTLAREGGVLTFEGESFVPNRAGLGDDPRTLCAAIDWVSVEPGIPPP